MTGPRGRDAIVAAVLDAAEVLLAADGPDKVSLRTIAAEAGVTYSLVNRHLGTRHQIVEALLARSEQRWRDRSAGATFGEAIHLLLGDDPDAGAYLRLLSWSLLQDVDELDTYRGHARMHELVPLAAEALGIPADAVDSVSEAEVAVAVALALVFGWRLFNPFIVEALHLGPKARLDLHGQLHRVIDHAINRGPDLL